MKLGICVIRWSSSTVVLFLKRGGFPGSNRKPVVKHFWNACVFQNNAAVHAVHQGIHLSLSLMQGSRGEKKKVSKLTHFR